MSILCDGLRGSNFPPNSGTHKSTPYAANFGAINENWLPNQQRVPSPTTTPDQPRSGRFNSASSRDDSGRRSHGTDRECPMSKNSATISPPRGSTTFRAFAICQPRDVAGSWLSSVEQHQVLRHRQLAPHRALIALGGGQPQPGDQATQFQDDLAE